jgi:hypothetical protein
MKRAWPTTSRLPTHLALPFRIMFTASMPCRVRHALGNEPRIENSLSYRHVDSSRMARKFSSFARDWDIGWAAVSENRLNLLNLWPLNLREFRQSGLAVRLLRVLRKSLVQI